MFFPATTSGVNPDRIIDPSGPEMFFPAAIVGSREIRENGPIGEAISTAVEIPEATVVAVGVCKTPDMLRRLTGISTVKAGVNPDKTIGIVGGLTSTDCLDGVSLNLSVPRSGKMFFPATISGAPPSIVIVPAGELIVAPPAAKVARFKTIILPSDMPTVAAEVSTPLSNLTVVEAAENEFISKKPNEVANPACFPSMEVEAKTTAVPPLDPRPATEIEVELSSKENDPNVI